jgi:hypothetical protein
MIPGRTCALLGGGLLAVSLALAQIPLQPPLPPRPLAPYQLKPNATVNAASGVPSLHWRQGGWLANSPQPAPARFFRLCVYDMKVQQTCDAPQIALTYAANSIELHPTPAPGVPSPVPSVYIFRFDGLPQTLALDRRWSWNVGACTSQASSSCVNSAPARLTLSTRDLQVIGIDEVISSGGLELTPIIANTGTTDSGRFRVEMFIHLAVYSEEGRCATSLDEDGVMPGYNAVTADGRFVELTNQDVPGTVGIERYTLTSEYADLSVGPGQIVRGPTLTYSVAGQDLPRAYLATAVADTNTSVDEYDELNNSRAECHVVFE